MSLGMKASSDSREIPSPLRSIVPSLPEGEPVAVVSVKATLGGNLRYTERRRGHVVSYVPKGIIVPARCPRGGFKFSGRFGFEDGTSTSAATVLACPRR
jgi:hypothetical protein